MRRSGSLRGWQSLEAFVLYVSLGISAMQSFDDITNSLGYLVVQFWAHAIKASELAKSTQETYEATSSYLQEMVKTQQAQQKLIEEQKHIIEAQAQELKKVAEKATDSIEEPPSKKPRILEKEGPASEYGGPQSGRSQYLCYRCHGSCGKSAKYCAVPLASLKGSSLIDLYSRVYVRKRPDVRREGEAVMEELRQRGLALPVDELTAKNQRKALLAFEQGTTTEIPMEYRLVPTEPVPVPANPEEEKETSGAAEVKSSEEEEEKEDPTKREENLQPSEINRNPEVRRLRENVHSFMRDVRAL